MSNSVRTGVLYTEHVDLRAATPLASLWSFASCIYEPHRPKVSLNQRGAHELWLERSDPLLNTILPGTHVSLILNFGDLWAAGRSLVASSFVPRACVMGPMTQHRILRLGKSVRAIGAVVPPSFARAVFGVPVSHLVDQLVALDDLWPPVDVRLWYDFLGGLDSKAAAWEIRNAIVQRAAFEPQADALVGVVTAALRTFTGEHASIDAVARRVGLSRRQFARRFAVDTGLSPKRFARIARFNGLIQALLSTDVRRWAAVSLSAGFYDQAHMINEFRSFAGTPPTVFFQPHTDGPRTTTVRARGRPSDWAEQLADEQR